MDMLIEDENCPAELRVDLMVLKTMQELKDSISNHVKPLALDKRSFTLAEKKALLEYLAMVKTGIESYQIKNKTEE